MWLPRSDPAENGVAVFYTEIPSLSEDQIGSLAHLLSHEELGRASRFVFAKDRQLYIAAHALLRFCLCAATGDPQWQLRVDRYGKPELEPPCGDPPLRLNLSHTKGLAACALSNGHAVGIDTEEINRRLDVQAVMKATFTAEEQRLLAASASSERQEIFYRLWTLKEAIVKGIGRGLSLSLLDFTFTLDPLSLTIATHAGEDAANWQMHELAPTNCHRLALAAKRRPSAILPVASQAISIDNLAEAGLALRAASTW